jgi:periplasmic protein CpxP/Spy
MTEQSNSAAVGSPEPIRPRRGRRWLFITTVALVAALTGAMATRAVGQYGPPGWGHMHGGHWFMRGPLSAAEVEDRVDRVVRHAAIELDATAEQQDKLRSIAKAAVKDLLPMREKARAARDRAKGLLTQPSIDRAAIEAFRAEQMALADAASKRFAQALGDVSEVLTPEQRQKVQEHLEWRRSHWRGWHRG